MSFDRPTLSELISRILSDIETRLEGTDAKLRRNVLNTLGIAFGGAAHGLHGNLEWLSKQIIYDTADDEILERWASIWGIFRKAASAATGSVDFTGTTGSVIPAGTSLQRSDGAEFTTDDDATLTAGAATVAVTAAIAGDDANTDAARQLSLVNPVDGVNSTATVATGGIFGGTDIEDYDDLRGRLLSRIRQAPHGGADFDYETWALEVSGVTRAWVVPQYADVQNQVGVFIVNDNADPIIPDSSKVADAQAYIDYRRPVTAQVLVMAPSAVALDMTIGVYPNTAAVKEAVESELSDMFSRLAEPGGTVYLSSIHEAISFAAGEEYHNLTVPAADVTHNAGEIAVMGTITWL